MQTIGERLEYAIKHQHSTNYAVSKHTGISQSTIGRIIKNEGKTYNRSTIATICKYLQISETWLHSGEGDMILPRIEAEEVDIPDGSEEVIRTKTGNEFIATEKGSSYMLVPLVGYYAYAGYLSGWSDPDFIEDLPKHMISVDVYHKGTYRAFVVRGDSMNSGRPDALLDGDIVTGRVIDRPLWNSKFHLKQYNKFIIVHKDGILVKNIKDHDVDNGVITVESINPDKRLYPDLTIHLDEVYELMNVVDLNRKTKFL
ncbi:helix-turn-helix domain-containing protein [Dyadobacter sp. Leaf189]|uniref:helix-turn-helix domain-containing protein n=1 Tax=Dyadobacter sp. Leaf189 TaxID=1736295 RepID=UPI0006F9653E|nr:helix-turn-helix domain-containing protein [Dyadobacter sp. Leaf189]KQS34017.1 hypothetical protein ASG33_08280 [Dyadobacter sp. Leaf189]